MKGRKLEAGKHHENHLRLLLLSSFIAHHQRVTTAISGETRESAASVMTGNVSEEQRFSGRFMRVSSLCLGVLR